METLFFTSSIIGDIFLVSLFIWHSCFRTKKLNEEIHAINERTKDCPYKKSIKRAK